MAADRNESYNNEIGKRLIRIMKVCDLTVAGFNALTGISDSHVYAIINGNRTLTQATANRIGKSLNFDGDLIFNLNKAISDAIGKSEILNNFRIENKKNYNYFISGVLVDKKSSVAFNLLKESDFLLQPNYLWEIRNFLNSSGKTHFDSDELSKILNYLVSKKMLSKTKAKIKLRSGKFGNRLVDVFFTKLDT
ncbi:MAG: hypothetical protein JKY70_14080 [Mucilaginibacter sp.]|nr:hypothetical protein [Mucilaginibacter sp.]